MVAGGVRIQWTDLPASLRASVGDALGSPVVRATSQPGGFSPGSADRVVLADGRRAFVKAVGTSIHPDSPGVNRREVYALQRLPPGLSMSRLLACVDDGDWVALVFEDVDGRHPHEPWQVDELDLVLDLLVDNARLLTPAPAGFGTLWDELGEDFVGWSRMRRTPPADLDAWTRAHLDELAAYEPRMPDALAGETLLHLDVRADNLLIVDAPAGPRAVLVDWPWVSVGAAWVDIAAFCVNVGLIGGADPEDVLQSRAVGASADPEAVTAFLVGLAAYFVESGRQPDHPRLPTLRAFQRAQGDVALAWLARRLS
jgi:hypothetical protein